MWALAFPQAPTCFKLKSSFQSSLLCWWAADSSWLPTGHSAATEEPRRLCRQAPRAQPAELRAARSCRAGRAPGRCVLQGRTRPASLFFMLPWLLVFCLVCLTLASSFSFVLSTGGHRSRAPNQAPRKKLGHLSLGHSSAAGAPSRPGKATYIFGLGFLLCKRERWTSVLL